MRFRVVNLGQTSLTRKKAFEIASLLASVISKMPSCFEGEDLTVAYALEDRLRTWGRPTGMIQTQELINLNSNEARVVEAARACEGEITIPIDDIETPFAPTPTMPGALMPKDSLPVLPLAAAGLGLVGIIAAIAID